MEQSRYLIVLPTYDERENLPRMIDALAEIRGQIPMPGEVLVVDDRSPDGTGQLADQLAARHDWLHTLHCNDPLFVKRAGRASWSNGVLRVQGPTVEVATKAVCTAAVRTEELNARIALPMARVMKLARGAQLRIAVGSAKPATGSYRPRAYCLHIAKPYDGYRSFDDCVDMLRWSGTVTVTRL